MKRKFFKGCKGLCFILTLVLLIGGCQRMSYKIGGDALTEIDPTQDKTWPALADNVMTMLNGESADYLNTISAGTEITFEKEWAKWMEFQETWGAYQSHNMYAAFTYGKNTVTQIRAKLEKADICINAKWNQKTKLMQLDLYLSPEDEEARRTVPEGVVEKDITVDAGTGFPLNGKLTLPEGAVNVPAVVLVQGNGAGNMDFSAGNTHVYRDLAWYLATKGIASIRYDKRTNAYDNWTSGNPTQEELSVNWEIIEDAAAASRTIKQEEAVDETKVYLVAHSLGALLSQRIDQEGGDFAGFVLLAAPSRTWQDAVFDQYLNYGLANIEEKNLYSAASYLESQKKDIDKKLDSYTDAQLLGEYLMGMPACYWKDINSTDNVQAIIDCTKPLFLMQGEADYQILPEVDFAGWQEKLEGKQNAELKSYEGLNHLLIFSEGCFSGCAKEYDRPGLMDEKAMGDIASFVSR